MFKLKLEDIHLGASANNKMQAIEQIAGALALADYAEAGYVDGMLKREGQTSTYLGNGIAIPHGTPDTRHFVKQTGVQVFQFPQGVKWGDEDQTAYVAIGISARSDEHLELLRQLTHTLNDDDIKDQLKCVTSAEDLRGLLFAQVEKDTLLLDRFLIALNVAGNSLVTLQALNVGNLHSRGAVDTDFIAESIAQKPVHLGQGIWLADSHKGNIISAIALSRPNSALLEEGVPVNLLVTASVANKDLIQPIMDNLANLLTTSKAAELFIADEATLLSMFTNATGHSEREMSAEFTVINSHGLHTRPGSLLVKTVRKFSSTITVANLDGTGKAVNAASLMKIVALGAKKGHRLRFTAEGNDASEALDAIGKAMAEGLGEETQ